MTLSAGINNLISEFRSWDWTYGKTPKFTVTRHVEMTGPNSSTHRLKLILEVQNGIVEDIQMALPEAMVPSGCNQNAMVISNLKGTMYSHEMVEKIIMSTGGKTIHVDTSQNADKNNVAATQ